MTSGDVVIGMSDTKKDADPTSGMIMLTPAELHDLVHTARHRTMVLCGIIDDRNTEIDAIAEYLSKQTFFDADGKQVWPEQDLKKRLHMAGIVSNSEKNISARLSDETIVDAMVALYSQAMIRPSLASQPLVYMFFEDGSWASSEMMRTINNAAARRKENGTESDANLMLVTSDIVMNDGIAVKLALLSASYARELQAEFAERAGFDPSQEAAALSYNVGTESATIIGLTHFGFSLNDFDIPVAAMARSRAMASSSRPAAEA